MAYANRSGVASASQTNLFGPVLDKPRLQSLRLKLSNFGLKHSCPICKSRLSHLRLFGRDLPVLIDNDVVGGGRRNAKCPCCKSSDRERLLYLFLLWQTPLFTYPTKLLHVAPEKRLTKRLASLNNIDYTTADLDDSPPRVMERMDITRIDYPNDSFDAIICNHVLEHVSDDGLAIRELHRVLRPEGWAILQVPIALSMDETFEDTSIVNPQERERVYGQHNHVRLYGKDYGRKLQNAGFSVREFSALDQPERFGYPENKYGLNPGETIYFVTKRSSQ